MRAHTLVAVLVGAFLPAAAAAQDTPRLGGLSPQRAFAESAEGKAGMARLSALEGKQAREIAARNQTLEARQHALEEKSGSLTESARREQTREVEKFRVDVQRFIQEAQAELVGAQREIESAFLVKLRPAVEQVAKTRQLLLVVNLDAESVVWVDPAADITSEVVKQLAASEPPRR